MTSNERVEVEVKATEVKPGDVMKVNAGAGWWIDVRIVKVTRDDEYVYVWFPMEVGPRRVLRANKRKVTSKVTVKRPA